MYIPEQRYRPVVAVALSEKEAALIVGGDITGYLAAYFLHQSNGNIKNNNNDDGNGDDYALSINMWEHSSYHSGYFGAIDQHYSATSDLGSQVLWTVDPSNPRGFWEGNGATME